MWQYIVWLPYYWYQRHLSTVHSCIMLQNILEWRTCFLSIPVCCGVQYWTSHSHLSKHTTISKSNSPAGGLGKEGGERILASVHPHQPQATPLSVLQLYLRHSCYHSLEGPFTDAHGGETFCLLSLPLSCNS